MCLVWFARSMEVLERWAKDPILLNMLQHQQLALGHTLPLGTYLCKPVQRILKYHLLLKARLIVLYFTVASQPVCRSGSAQGSTPAQGPGRLGSVSLSPLPSTREHPSYGDCLEVKREYYQNCSVLGCVSSSYRSSRLGLSHWDP